MKTKVLTSLASVLLTLMLMTPANLFAENYVNVYSSRIEKLIKPAFDLFTKETGIKVNFTTASEAELIERLKAEEKYTKADMLITVDAGNLWIAAKNNLLQPVKSDILNSNIPSSLRDPLGQWYGLTVRSRTIVYSSERVTKSELSTYEDLGNPKWKNRLCLRTSKKVYNKSLIASMIKSLGQKKTEQIVSGWMKNDPKIYPKDSSLLNAIVAGKCDVGIVNTYYLGRQIVKNPKYPVTLFWANQKGRGVHVNISGAGVTKYAKRKNNSLKLLEFLSSKKAQNLFADNNLEYPANQNVKPSEQLIKWWGSFKQDQVNVASAGELQKDAVFLMTTLGYK